MTANSRTEVWEFFITDESFRKDKNGSQPKRSLVKIIK